VSCPRKKNIITLSESEVIGIFMSHRDRKRGGRNIARVRVRAREKDK
jgi:hypothetical protein